MTGLTSTLNPATEVRPSGAVRPSLSLIPEGTVRKFLIGFYYFLSLGRGNIFTLSQG
jgi:hypothetical protein